MVHQSVRPASSRHAQRDDSGAMSAAREGEQPREHARVLHPKQTSCQSMLPRGTTHSVG
jgi:hypothetical protein